MVGLKLATHLYTKRPWIRKPVIGVRVMEDRTIFWCNSRSELEFLRKFLREKGLDTEKFTRGTVEPDDDFIMMFSPTDVNNMLRAAVVGCSVSSSIDLGILEELREDNYLAINLKDAFWILR